jgi:hypothetical protein
MEEKMIEELNEIKQLLAIQIRMSNNHHKLNKYEKGFINAILDDFREEGKKRRI